MESAITEWQALAEEYWQAFVRFLPRGVMALLVVLLAFWVSGRIRRLVGSRLMRKADDRLLTDFLSRLAKLGVIVIGVLVALRIMGFTQVAGGLLAGAGVSAFIIGFAFKDIGENFLAGVILAFNRPFDISDTILVNEMLGRVLALNLRTTHVKTFDGKDIYIPNSIIIKQPVTNYTRDGLLRVDFTVGIDFGDDMDAARAVALRAVEQTEEVRYDFSPFVTIDELSVSTVNLRVYFWTDARDYRKGVIMLKSEVIRNVKTALLQEGFTLPANVQELKLYKNDQPITVNVRNVGEDNKPVLDGKSRAERP